MGGKESKSSETSEKKGGNQKNGESEINLTKGLIIGKIKKDPNIDYKKLNFLGEGSFSSVYKVQNRMTDVIRAMKIINRDSLISSNSEDDKEIFNEFNILQSMDHPNILKIFEFYSNNQTYNIITEYCSGGELYKEIVDRAPFNEKYSSYIMYQIFSAINYCHKMNIIHRDIKPENIFLVDRNKYGFPRIKIGGFGTSKIISKGTLQNKLVGSSYYVAPEVIEKSYNEKCDLWSCGVILYILLSGHPPFIGDNNSDVLNNICKGEYDLQSTAFDTISSNAKDLIQKLLIIEPKRRINAEQALNHPWFEENKTKKLYNQIKDENTIKKLINNLKAYKSNSIIQKTALAYLVHNFPQMEEIIIAGKLFNQIDVDSDGKISQVEFFEGIRKLIKSDLLENDITAIYKNIDINDKGYLEYEEFVSAAIDKDRFLTENILRFAFRYFDKNNSGEITFNEIAQVYKGCVFDQTRVEESLAKIIKEVDFDCDGKISFEEFSEVMNKMKIEENQ